ncbi:MAG TPA: hypothetical protein V6C78_01885 [Crinalium sp.]
MNSTMARMVSMRSHGTPFAPFQPRVTRLKWRYRVHVDLGLL